MPGPYGTGSIPFLYNDFTGGMNTLDAPDLLTDNEARDVMNLQATTAGEIIKRDGLKTYATPTDTLTSLFSFEAVAPPQLVGAGGTHLYSVAIGGATASIKAGLTAGQRWEFISAPVMSGQGPMYGMNGTDTPQQWDGIAAGTGNWTATDAGGAVPNGQFCIYVQNQVFVSGVAAFPSRVFWSAIGDPTGWNPANLLGAGFMDLDPFDGQPITAIGTVGPYVLIAKARKLWVLLSAATAQTRMISNNVGVTAHRSLASGPEGTYFLAEDRGVYLTNGSTLTPVSDKIQPTIDLIQPGLRSQAAAAYVDAHYYLSVPVATTNNDLTLDYDAKLSAPNKGVFSWWKHSFGSNQFAIWHPAGDSELYSAKSTGAYVDRCFTPDVRLDNGLDFTWAWRGPWQSPTFYRRRRFPTPYFRKRLRQMRFAGTGQIDFSLAKDFALGETLIRSDIFSFRTGGEIFGGAGTFGGAGVFGEQFSTKARVYNLGVANAFSVVLSGTNPNPASLQSYVLMMTDRRDLVT